MAVKKLFSFNHKEVAERLSKESNQSSLVEQLVAAHYQISLDQEKLNSAGREIIPITIHVTKTKQAEESTEPDWDEPDIGSYCLVHNRKKVSGLCPLCELEKL